jgi:hypothetical protein
MDGVHLAIADDRSWLFAHVRRRKTELLQLPSVAWACRSPNRPAYENSKKRANSAKRSGATEPQQSLPQQVRQYTGRSRRT